MPDPSTPGNPNPAVTTLSLKPGDKVDAFTVVDTIATTGSAVVYKAHDDLLDRHVAIKQIILGQEDSDEALRKRIREEAAIHKRVSTSQPKHLIQFIDAVDDPRGLMLVGEYYPSTSLEDLLQKTDAPLDERQALGIVAATAKGLEAIHGMGVVHRDLKPSNILLGDDGGLKICDFGLSALIESQDSLSLGSVRYMAPELLKSEPADGRADLYSLGIIAYEMLAGRGNFDVAFRNVLRDQRNQAMRWMKWHTNLRVSAPLLDEYLPDLPTHLVQLVSRMMDKDQARRVGSAEDVVEAIRRHFTGDGPDLDLAPSRSIDHPAITTSTPGDTTALPSRSKLPLLLGSFLLFWVVVFGVLFAINDYKKTAAYEQKLAAATTSMDQGNTLYQEGDFAGSLESYESVVADWPAESDMAQRATRGKLKAMGRIAFAEARYDDAVDVFEQYKDAGGNPANVDGLILEAKDNEAFAQIDLTIQNDVENADFTAAQDTLKKARERDWNDGQNARLDALETLIEERRAEALAAQRIEDARRLVNEGDRPAAIATLEDLANLPEEGQTLLETLKADQAYDDAIAKGEEAIRTGRLGEAVDSLNAALALRPDSELQARIIKLDARRLAAEAAALFDDGEVGAAKLRIAAALEKDPENPDALRLQKQIAVKTELTQIEQRGDAALAAGNLDAAITAFEEALALAPGDTALAGKLNRTRVRRGLDQARAAIDADELTQAEALLKDAQLLDPDSEDILGLLAQIETQRGYDTFVQQGDRAKEAGDFGRAKRFYRQAKELIPGKEIDQLLEDLDYAQYLTQARDFIAKGEFAAARAMLLQAQRIRSTPEIEELIKKTESQTPPEGESPPPADE
ncbi:serine/threonine-protein kinase [Algisphaera agarilytica]|uniref:non-specific serine/threonine protein kinase n=1 Tax=Algisphaera agarilytica TaxID=1385975 RepID=A0A7X0H387_9BACT|nr:serine/threonine-protein kinase [Algisphaera agarilytica]MBB6428263.1 serine/threonine protein kinase [Algisphaera agarilytica]